MVIVGAGPSGLFGAYYAGFRGLSVLVVDSLPEVGGQVSAMYPEKLLFDVPGFPTVRGRDLVARLAEQAAQYEPAYRLGETVTSYTFDEQAGIVHLATGGAEPVTCGAVILTAGLGSFTPRPLPAAQDWHGEGLAYFARSLAEYSGRHVVVVGGGDSAVDWAMMLAEPAASVTLVHRREAFRAHPGSMAKLAELDVDVRRGAEVTALVGERELREVEITDLKSQEATRVRADRVIAALGFRADLGPLAGWGLRLQRRQVMVDTTMATNLPRVFAAGDLAHYPGKVRLIATGFGEVATAVNNAAVMVDPRLSLFPGHSTDQVD